MNNSKIQCPRCNSTKLYKFGFDKQANQKYQCRECKRQFVPSYVNSKPKKNYPKCPRCSYGTYLHHKHKHYNRYKCNNRKCNHIIVQHHTANIDPASCDKVTGLISMKGMRFPLQTIITALSLYFLNNSSTRAIALLILTSLGIKVPHKAIANLTKKFAPYFKHKADNLKSQLNFQSDDWHANETVVFIKGIKYLPLILKQDLYWHFT